MTINIEPAERALAFIEAHPEQHNQEVWTCATGACLAGHIALQNGYVISVLDNPNGDPIVMNGDVLDAQGNEHDVLKVAQELLGIETWKEAMTLFAATNTVEKMKLMVKDLANGENLQESWKQVGLHPNGIYPIFERIQESGQ